MNRLCPLFTILLAAILLQACKGVVKSDNDADTISATDSVKAVTDTSKIHVPLSKEDTQFITDVTSKALTEIEVGKLAQQKAQNKRVKNFGTMMYKDITKAINRLNLIAQHKHITLPTTPLQGDEESITKLSKLSGKGFDTAYADFLIDGHKKYIAIFEDVVRNSGDPEVKSFAKATLTPLKNHLDAIITINQSMK